MNHRSPLRAGLTLALVAGLAWSAFPAPKLRPTDPPRPVGRWAVEQMTVYGKDGLPGNADFTYTFTADGAWVIRDDWDGQGRYWAEGNKIDLRTEAGRTLPGVFRVEGDRLTICLGEPGDDRPTGFKTGPRLSLFVFRRVPPK